MGISMIGWGMFLLGGLVLAGCLIAFSQMRRRHQMAGASISRVAGCVQPIQSFYTSGAMDQAAEAAAATELLLAQDTQYAEMSTQSDDLLVAAQLTTGAVGTAVSSIALDTTSVGLDPKDRRLQPMLTELVDIRRPAAVSDLFADQCANVLPAKGDEFLTDTRRMVIRAYRSSGKGACLVVPVTGEPGMFFDLRIERYSAELADVCHEMFEILAEIVDWSADRQAEITTPVLYGGLPQTVPAQLRALRSAIRDLQLPPAYDYIRGEIDAYAGAMSGRVDAKNVLQVVDRFGRVDLPAAGLTPDVNPPARLLCLITLIAVWDALLLNFGFSEKINSH